MTTSHFFSSLLIVLLFGFATGIDYDERGRVGSISHTVTDKKDVFTWYIKPDSVSAIYFAFKTLNINSAEFSIFDAVNQDRGKPLFTCVGYKLKYGLTLPPPFYSTTGEVVIIIRGIDTQSFLPSNFEIQYACQISSTAYLNQPWIPKNFNFTLSMGYGTISPILVGGTTLPAKARMQWLLVPTFHSGQKIIFSFANFSIPLLTDKTCSATITIYGLDINGKQVIIYSGCEQPKRWLYSPFSSTFVVLQVADEDVQASFHIIWYLDIDKYRCGSIFSVDALNFPSMVITDGSSTDKEMRTGENCQWLITQPSGVKLILLMQWVLLKSSSMVQVFDGSSPSGILIWDTTGGTTIVPPPLRSSDNSLFITYSSNSDISTPDFKGFYGEYYSINKGSAGIGSQGEILASSSALNIRPPGDGESYMSSTNYTWLIKPYANLKNVKSSAPITIAFSEMNLVKDSSDTLVLYDGDVVSNNILVKYQGNTPQGNILPTKWIISSSSSSSVLVRFQTDRKPDKKGNFEFSYWTDGPNYHCGFQSGPDPGLMRAPSMSFTDGSPSTDSIYKSQNCVWKIAPTDASGIFIFFERFDLMSASLSIYLGDSGSSILYVTIQNANVVPAPIVINATVATIVYSSTTTAKGIGFSGTYYSSSTYFSGPGNGIITLKASSVLSFSASVTKGGWLLPGVKQTWVINPPSSNGSIYFVFSSLSLPPGFTLSIYDGSIPRRTLLGAYTGSIFTPNWIMTSSPLANLVLDSTSSISQKGNFELSYYSNGPNVHCGFPTNPGVLKAASFVITDGSPEKDVLYFGQDCIWIIDPTKTPDSIILEFTECDLLGAYLEVRDGPSSSDPLLWICNNCQTIPGPLIGTSGKLYVHYTSQSSFSNPGMGFRSFYWSIPSIWRDETIKNRLLELPADIVLSNARSNNSISWEIGIPPSDLVASLIYQPSISVVNRLSTSAVDGRRANSNVFKSLTVPGYSCGNILSSAPSYLTDNLNVRLMATQMSENYLQSSSQAKYVYSLTGSWDSTPALQTFTPPILPAKTCRYVINSGSDQAVNINIIKFTSTQKADLIIYGGIYTNDAILFVSYKTDVYNFRFTAPCGKATIILQQNSTSANLNVDYGLQFEYVLVPNDQLGSTCAKYKQSLLPPPKKVDIITPILISASSLVFCLLSAYGVYYVRKNWHLFASKSRNYRVISPHPKYTPKLDEFLNKFLRKGTCCVCQDGPLKVFRLKCNHSLCLTCLKGYIEAALGDISMFPVKCPMHYEGCNGNIVSSTVKRILAKSQYERFLEFSDRAMYGDGMRCIFCNNFVNFPPDAGMSMVECPYCIQRFCLRCKKPWHYGGKCPLDNVSDDLEAWKRDSGAQKCPSCSKLIEKDDPDTCHHMVHKITDGIPCIRDRTDFCYLCGTEVTPDYPHEEVDNPGVNHFPDGVFQKCRIKKQKEKEIERERLRKLRRNRKPAGPGSANKIIPSFADDWGDSEDPFLRPGTGGNGNGVPNPWDPNASTPISRAQSPNRALNRSRGGRAPNS